MAYSALIDSIADRLARQLVTPAGEAASRAHVADVVAGVAGSMASARLQQFVPLLVENAARNQLHDEGLRRTLA